MKWNSSASTATENEALRRENTKLRRAVSQKKIDRVIDRASIDACMMIDMWKRGFLIGRQASANAVPRRRHIYATALMRATGIVNEKGVILLRDAELMKRSIKARAGEIKNGRYDDFIKHIPAHIVRRINYLKTPLPK